MTFEEQREVQELKRRVRELEAQVEQDSLTGLLNRRGAERRLEEAAAYAVRTNTPLAVALIDVDHFKRVNDTRGHPAGDDALRTLGQVIHTVVRRYDGCARWGGEEFALVLPGMTTAQAFVLAERLRQQVEEVAVTTVSIGVATVTDGDWRTAMVRADAALYASKHEGRNRVHHG